MTQDKKAAKALLLKKAEALWEIILQTPGAKALAPSVMKRVPFNDLLQADKVTVAVILTAYEKATQRGQSTQEGTEAAPTEEEAGGTQEEAGAAETVAATADDVIDPKSRSATGEGSEGTAPT